MFIKIKGLSIFNQRKESDFASLDYKKKSVKQGSDGYPIKDQQGHYCIAGGQDHEFKATALEIYGIKERRNWKTNLLLQKIKRTFLIIIFKILKFKL